jgi:hypothetical protein
MRPLGFTRTVLVGIHFGEHLEPRETSQVEFYDYQEVAPDSSSPRRRGMLLSFAAYADILHRIAP